MFAYKELARKVGYEFHKAQGLGFADIAERLNEMKLYGLNPWTGKKVEALMTEPLIVIRDYCKPIELMPVLPVERDEADAFEEDAL